MKTILLFGAGKSASVLISFLIKRASEGKIGLIVADMNRELILAKTENSEHCEAVETDINDPVSREDLITRSDIIISMMPPALHILIARDCLRLEKHLLTASYADDAIRSLHEEASRKGLLFLCEMGLDPGIDHMSAMRLIRGIKDQGGSIYSFLSHCGGLVAPESDDNPWHYKISWNPRNVVLAGKAGAIYKLNGVEINEPYEQLFDASRATLINDPEIRQLSYYPNRNSLPYISLYELDGAQTFMRTTLRHTEFMYGWKNIVDLKLTDETPRYETSGRTLYEFYREHLELNGFGEWLQKKLTGHFTETKALLENLMKLMEAEEEAQLEGAEVPANIMMVDETGDIKDVEIDEIKSQAASTVADKMHEANLIMKQLFFLGLDDQETMINKGTCSAADVLQFVLENKLKLEDDDRDLVVMQHEIGYMLNDVPHNVTSTLVVKGEDSRNTAMAKTVGLPLAISAMMLAEDKLKIRGVHVPVNSEIYDLVLPELEREGIIFREEFLSSDKLN